LKQHLPAIKIAIVTPLFEHIPPTKYGGTERIIHYLVEQLVALGHSVTLYATDGSQTSAKLIPCYSGTLREHGIGSTPQDTEKIYTSQVKLACSALPAHDIVHIHHGLYPYHPAVLETITSIPFVWTDHNAVHNDGKPEIIKRLSRLGIKLTALSDSHRNTVSLAPWTATTHHGLPINLLNAKPADPLYLAFLGRISPEKGICDAIGLQIARRYSSKLRLRLTPWIACITTRM
jgi:glycosyltransferase involved in cell wall biosynthesis